MQPETRTEPRNAVGAEVRHALSEKDRKAVAAMRKEVAPFKGKMSDPSARPPFDEVMVSARVSFRGILTNSEELDRSAASSPSRASTR